VTSYTHQLSDRCTKLLAFAAILLLTSTSHGQILLDVDFDQSPQAVQNFAEQASLEGTLYTEAMISSDFGELRFTNGVDEGRVRLVTGEQAYGGTGASLMVQYPAGSSGPGEGGAQWLAEYETDIDEAYLSYRVKFRDGFDFVRGGKLPGLAGGSAPSGNAPADGIRGWTGRMMWRTDFTGFSGQPEQAITQGISYAKHVNSGFDQDGQQEDTAYWIEDNGSDTAMAAGVWYTIRQRIKLNNPGQRDGILQIWLDGRMVLDQQDVQFRDTSNLKIDRFFFSTFFGGGDDWRSSKDEVAFFDDFRITVPQQRLVPEQYASVQAAVAAANPGDTILLGSADWYANLYLNQPLTLQGRGGSRLLAADGSRPVIEVDSDSVTISQLDIDRGVQGVIAYAKANGLRIRGCDFTDNFGDAIRAIGCRDVSIRDCDLISNRGRGVFLDQVEGFYLSNCIAAGNGGAGFELFSDGGFVRDCQAMGNQAGAGFFLIGSRCGFQNNLAMQNQGMGFLLINGESIGFFANRAQQNSSFGILADGVNNADFSGNLIQQNDGVGVIFNNASGVAFQSNDVSYNSGIGAYFSNTTSGNYFRGNQYQGNAFAIGLINDGQ
jgi:nitrous oxidase accessory protein NosD